MYPTTQPIQRTGINPAALTFDSDTIQKMKIAKQAGYDDNAVLQKAVQYQSQKAQMGTQPNKQESNFLLDILPLVGAVGGSFIPGLGTIAGGAVGAGLGTLLKQGLYGRNTDWGEVGKEALFAGAGGVVGKGLGWAGSKLLPKAGGILGDIGENLAVRGLRPTPSQITRFSAETGEGFGDFLTKRGISNLDDVISKTNTLQKSFDDVVLSKNLLVDPNDVVNGFSTVVERLNKSILPADRQKAQVLQQIASNFIDQYGKGPIPASALTALRREVDDSIKSFALDEAVKGPLNLTRDVFQDSLRNAADNAGLTVGGSSLKDAGVELSKLYKVLEIGERQANLGKGSMPLGITRLLGGAVGGATGGIPGALGGVAATSAINNPEIIGMLSRFSRGAGNVLSQAPTMSEASIPALTRTGIGTGTLLGSGQPQVEQPQAMFNADGSQIPLPASMTSNAGLSQEEALRQVLGAIMFSKAKNVSDIKTAYEFLNPTTNTKKTEKQQLFFNAARAGEDALGLLETGGVKSGIGQGFLGGIGEKLGTNSPTQQQYRSAVAIARTTARNAMLGANMTEKELESIQAFIPEYNDAPNVARVKLQTFIRLMDEFSGNLQGTAPETGIPYPTSYQGL